MSNTAGPQGHGARVPAPGTYSELLPASPQATQTHVKTYSSIYLRGASQRALPRARTKHLAAPLPPSRRPAQSRAKVK
jgi:hypothetical protein